MSEEIIIDGVDVSECVHCSKVNNTIICSDYITGLCEDYNCEYKHIKRLKQENAELKKENERLKTLYRNEGITDICEACSVTSAMEAYDYYKALGKIRTSLKNQIEWEGQLDCCERKILKIINEVLNDSRE